jgi:hypothetical protein
LGFGADKYLQLDANSHIYDHNIQGSHSRELMMVIVLRYQNFKNLSSKKAEVTGSCPFAHSRTDH